MASSNRKAINWRLVGIGLALQLVFGLLIVKVPVVAQGFRVVSQGFVTLISFSGEGAQFLFSGLAVNSFENPSAAGHSMGVIVAFQVLPSVIFFSTLSAGLYYLGALQKVVYGIAWVMARTMRLSGAESLSAAGNIFLGQTEAPLLVKPYISRMTQSELMTLMTGGMATLAGAVLAVYVKSLGGGDPETEALFAARLLSASIMNAPAGIVLAKILIPETTRTTNGSLDINQEAIGVNLLDALTRGASDGLKLALNIGAMLLAFIALIAMLNFILRDLVGASLGLNALIAESSGGTFSGLTLEYLFGQVFRLVAFIIGVEWNDTLVVGSLLGQKTVINEFVAYDSLAQFKAQDVLSEKSVIIATYALCGFSNFSSIAIQIGGIGAMAPDQQQNLSRLGLRALLAATLACLMTATLAGALF